MSGLDTVPVPAWAVAIDDEPNYAHGSQTRISRGPEVQVSGDGGELRVWPLRVDEIHQGERLPSEDFVVLEDTHLTPDAARSFAAAIVEVADTLDRTNEFPMPSTTCTRYPCDHAYQRCAHRAAATNAPHRVAADHDNELTGDGEIRRRWDVAAVAAGHGPWKVQATPATSPFEFTGAGDAMRFSAAVQRAVMYSLGQVSA